MDIKTEIENIIKAHNTTTEQVAKLISNQPEKFQKRFEQDKIRFQDAQKILDILGYGMTIYDDYLK